MNQTLGKKLGDFFKPISNFLSKNVKALGKLPCNATQRETFTQTVIKNIQTAIENIQDHSSYGLKYCTSFKKNIARIEEK